MELKTMLSRCFSLLIFLNTNLLAQKKIAFPAAIESMDTTKIFLIDSNLIALNQIRKKIGLQKKLELIGVPFNMKCI